ncbi:hypothetical protein [Yoonia vestfoldensis]|jgi:hypothetical protein|uniref:Uncharacterized protein n=1 Tax=Yoonia vestfoldensis SKA53 TaxID=314232 RepID=A3V6X6_9RHOB|nr:hypothetical protein [Yoonia vestfoldensis]EAQ05992.1 hypothetical protein SKA53_07801 [Yoonia vestfoldensis SKA53]
MTGYIKDMHIEFKLFELYGLREVIAAAQSRKVAQSDFVALAETVLSEGQARAFAARWPTLTQAEQTQVCTMLEKDHG